MPRANPLVIVIVRVSVSIVIVILVIVSIIIVMLGALCVIALSCRIWSIGRPMGQVCVIEHRMRRLRVRDPQSLWALRRTTQQHAGDVRATLLRPVHNVLHQ